jgi:hypothetical protein
MPSTKGAVAIPILIIVVGVGWLLTNRGVAPGIDWVWTLGLGVVGILTFILSGFDKLTVVIGPFLLLSSVLSVLRQRGQLALDVEVPVLVISFGVFLLIAQLPAVPKPHWLTEASVPPPESPKKLKL